jgi:ABC-type lipoprotein release transport system permease subunit
MKQVVIAWRNLWRNKRRTLITVASIFFGVLLAVIMSSMQEGSYANMIDNVVKFYSGYIQIHDEEYWENKTLYYSFDANDELYKSIESADKITMVNPRLESYALASSEDITQPAMIVGVDPQKEERLTGLSKWIIDGEFLSAEDDGILLSAGLAKNLKVSANDTLALLSQGYYGNTVAELFPVRGILDFPSPELNKRFAYLELKKAQEFYGAEGKLTSLVLMVKNYKDVKVVMNELKTKIKSPYSAMSWDEMQPELVQVIEGDRAGGMVMKAILYMIIAFGILGTIMMMIAERRKELGVMVAVGMQKYKLAGILFYETMFMGLIGVVSGILVSIPIIIYMIHNPIPVTGDAAIAMKDMGIEPVMMFTGALKVFLNQVITVLAITFLISFYPLISIGRMIVIKYLRD